MSAVSQSSALFGIMCAQVFFWGDMKDGLGCKQNFSDLGVDSFCFRGTTSTRSEPFEVIMFCCAGWKQVFILQKPMSSHVHSAKTYECVCPFCKNLCLAHAFFKNLWMLQQVGTQSRSWQRNSNLLLCCGASGSLHVVHACW
jgi:hypothetical protein